MVKVEKCIGSNCFTYIRVSDGKHKPALICQPKKKCDDKQRSDNFREEFQDLITGTSKTIYTTEELFKNPKEGEELDLGLFD